MVLTINQDYVLLQGVWVEEHDRTATALSEFNPDASWNLTKARLPFYNRNAFADQKASWALVRIISDDTSSRIFETPGIAARI